MEYRSRLIVSLVACAALLAACRGGAATSPMPPAGDAPPVLDAVAATAPIAFTEIGPTRLTYAHPNSGKVNAYAVDPSNPKVVYVASGHGTGLESNSSAGIYKTTDGGASWRPLTNGLIDEAGYVSSEINALWLDPNRPAVLLAASEYDGVYRSDDAGASWQNVYRTTHATEFAAFGGAVYVATAAGVLSSSDDGQTWSVSLAASAKRQPTALTAVAGTSGSAFYAGMTDGSIYTFNGGTWTRAGVLPYHQFSYGGRTPEVHQIAVDPYAPSTVYASANDGLWDQDLHASTDGGRTWTIVLKSQYVRLGLGTQAIGFSLVHPHRLYLGEDGGFYYIAGDGKPNPQVREAAKLQVVDVRNVWPVANGADDACWVASDQGLDYEPACSTDRSFRDTVVSSTIASGLARHIATSPDGRTIVASLQDFASFVSTDGGATWKASPLLYEDGFNLIPPSDPKTCYVIDDIDLKVSSDGCNTFRVPSPEAHRLWAYRLFTEPITADPSDPRRVYFTAVRTESHYHFSFGVFSTADGGKTIAQVPGKFYFPGSIRIDRTNAKHMIVGDVGGGFSTLWTTFDGGAHWTKAKGVPGEGQWYCVAMSPADGKTVLATNVDARDNVFVLRSTDGGLTYKRLTTLTNAPAVRGPGGDERMARRSPAYVYSPARDLAFNDGVTKGTPDVVATTLRGAFLSTDLGTTWRRIDGDTISHSFWGVYWLKGYLYLGSDGQGVLRSTTALQ